MENLPDSLKNPPAPLEAKENGQDGQGTMRSAKDASEKQDPAEAEDKAGQHGKENDKAVETSVDNDPKHGIKRPQCVDKVPPVAPKKQTKATKRVKKKQAEEAAQAEAKAAVEELGKKQQKAKKTEAPKKKSAGRCARVKDDEKEVPKKAKESKQESPEESKKGRKSKGDVEEVTPEKKSRKKDVEKKADVEGETPNKTRRGSMTKRTMPRRGSRTRRKMLAGRLRMERRVPQPQPKRRRRKGNLASHRHITWLCESKARWKLLNAGFQLSKKVQGRQKGTRSIHMGTNFGSAVQRCCQEIDEAKPVA